MARPPTVLALVLVAGCFNIPDAPDWALRALADNCAAPSKPTVTTPGVEVFVPEVDAKRFTDANLIAIIPALDRIRNFTTLNIARTRITDEPIPRLAAVGSLEVLNVSETSVTTRSLIRLAACPKLRRVIISRSQFGDAEIAELKRALAPRVAIEAI